MCTLPPGCPLVSVLPLASIWVHAVPSRWLFLCVSHRGGHCGPSSLNLFLRYLDSLADPGTASLHCCNCPWPTAPGRHLADESFPTAEHGASLGCHVLQEKAKLGPPKISPQSCRYADQMATLSCAQDRNHRVPIPALRQSQTCSDVSTQGWAKMPQRQTMAKKGQQPPVAGRESFRHLLWALMGVSSEQPPPSHVAGGIGGWEQTRGLSRMQAPGLFLALVSLYDTAPACGAKGTKLLCVTQGNGEPAGCGGPGSAGAHGRPCAQELWVLGRPWEETCGCQSLGRSMWLWLEGATPEALSRCPPPPPPPRPPRALGCGVCTNVKKGQMPRGGAKGLKAFQKLPGVERLLIAAPARIAGPRDLALSERHLLIFHSGLEPRTFREAFSGCTGSGPPLRVLDEDGMTMTFVLELRD
ncbi:uncharacterized protein LOC119876595 [Canis lupus familiaris]|uniref:uncharacterized protein LOC119876595 n=1 Tax=Canis lupus familiaris TaxID=9615 RepID=UPI0018F49C62|nr:uncharacterized protein LOC119876595 [Canis lupus familiaris]